MPKNKAHILIGAFVLLFAACNNSIVYSKYHIIPDSKWDSDKKAVFDIEITDTQTLNNISLMLRHADDYPFSNLYLFVKTKYPDGKELTDTMEVILANEKGEWYGGGVGDLYDLKIPIKKNVRFPLAGKYHFEFEQGMRVDPLPLISDFGFEVEKVN